MRQVDRPYTRPNVCAAKPHIGPAGHPAERWVDTTAELSGFDNHVYLCETSIREAAATLGLEFVDDAGYEASMAELDDAVQERDELAAKLADLEAFRDSVNIVVQAKAKP